MKILHVITGMRKAAGTSVFVGELSHKQVGRGHQVTIVHRETWRKDNFDLDPMIEFVGETTFWTTVNNRSYDIVHIHGLWETMLHRFARYAKRRNIRIVWSTHGALAKWAFNYKLWKKLPAWWLYQKRDLKQATLIHVTAQSEIADMQRVGLTNNVVVAPLGVNLPDCLHASSPAKHGITKAKLLSFIGRVAPIKGLDNLLSAFATKGIKKMAEEKNWRLVITGPDQDGYTAEIKSLVRKLGIEDFVEFSGPKFGDELQVAYDVSDVFVLPSYSENFGSVVVEALAHGVPVITTKGTPWKELEEHGCGWWIDVGVDPLAKTLLYVMSLTDEQRRVMGARGRQLVEERYTWDAVATNVLEGYEDAISTCQ